MPFAPAPTIEADLGLIVQPLTRADTSHVSEVTFSVVNTSALTPQVVINDFQTAFNAHVANIFDIDVASQPPSLKLGNGTNVPLVAVATGVAVVGSTTDATPPANVSVIVKKLTALGGKKNRGRTYYPWFVKSSNLNEVGNIDTAILAGYNTALEAFRATLAADGIPMVIAHRTLAIVPPRTKPSVTAITAGPIVTSYTIEPMVGTQRRRLGR